MSTRVAAPPGGDVGLAVARALVRVRPPRSV